MNHQPQANNHHFNGNGNFGNVGELADKNDDYDNFDNLMQSVNQNGMSNDQRVSMLVLNSQMKLEKQNEAKKPEIITKLKPKVESIIQECVVMNKSEAEITLQKLEKLNKKNEDIQRSLAEVKLKNEEIK